IPGVSAPPPFGGAQRTIVVSIDPQRLQALKLSPETVAQALAQGNTISPSGNIRIQERMPLVPVNSMVVQPDELRKVPVPVGNGQQVLLEDVAVRDPLTGAPRIEDANDITTGYALVNGRRAVYILATKRADASTVDVVNNIKANLDRMQKELPPEIR